MEQEEPMRLASVAFAVLLCGTMLSADSAAKLSLVLQPNVVVDRQFAQLVITAVLPANFVEGSFEIQAPPGFTVEPASVHVVGAPGSVAKRTVTLKANDLSGDSHQATVIVDFLSGVTLGQRVKIGSSESLELQYRNTWICIGLYLAVGLLGVLIGYAIRLLVKVLGTIPAPSPEPPEPAAGEGPITRFVRGHYYFVDCSVTAILALLMMAALIKNGRPPESASQWYGALVAGAALGLLTNSELITKIPVPRNI
jgi:hypothetical protein